MTDARKYSNEDVRAIVDRALRRGGGEAGDITHAELLAIGEQVGVSPEAMARAADEVYKERLEQAAKREVVAGRRRWLALHAAVYLLLNGLFFAVNALTTPGEWWALLSIVIWGLVLGLHTILALGLPPSASAIERKRKKLAPASAARGTKLRVAGVDAATSSAGDELDEQRQPGRHERRSI